MTHDVSDVAHAIGQVQVIYLTAAGKLVFHASSVKQYVFELEAAGANPRPDLKGHLRHHAAELRANVEHHGTEGDKQTVEHLLSMVETYLQRHFGEGLVLNAKAA